MQRASLIANGTISFLAGIATLSNVEFAYSGQGEYIDPTDPRFSIAFVDAAPDSYVKV